jgi:hypothetical protein
MLLVPNLDLQARLGRKFVQENELLHAVVFSEGGRAPYATSRAVDKVSYELG